MKRIGQALFFLILSTSISIADDPPRTATEQLLLFSQGFTFNSGLGFSNLATSTIWNISAANPASLADFPEISAGVSMQYASRIEDAFGFDIAYERVNPWLPQSFGLVLPFHAFRMGVGFNQKYSHSLDFGEIPILTVNNPQGSGETYHPVFETYVYSGSGMISYALPRFINPSHGLALGAQIDVDFLRNYQEIPRLSATGTDQAISWKAGIRYRFLDLLKLGAAFEKGASFSGNIEWEEYALLMIPDSGFISQSQFQDTPFTADLPDRLSFGWWLKISEQFSLANDFSFVYWENVYSSLKNQMDISGSVYFLASEKISFSAGFYSTRWELNDAFFMSVGILANFKPLRMELTVADSHLASSDTRKQTLARLGLGVSL